MDMMDGAIQELASRVPRPPSESIDSDGIYRCSVCGEQTRCFIEVMGRNRLVPCTCKCGRERLAEKARRNGLAELERRKETCFPSKDMWKWTFENDDRTNGKLSDSLIEYADNFEEFKKKGIGFIFYGNVGTGKSYYAAAIANRVMEQGYSAYMTNFATIAGRLQGWKGDRDSFLRDLNSYSLLILDDLGAERNSTYMQEIVHNVIDSRHSAGKPMIITTNMTADELKNPQDITLSRIYDRILEKCFPKPVSGNSRRRRETRNMMEDMRNRLGL